MHFAVEYEVYRMKMTKKNTSPHILAYKHTANKALWQAGKNKHVIICGISIALSRKKYYNKIDYV